MKKEKLLRAMELIDDAYVEEADPKKAKPGRKKGGRAAITTCICTLAAAAAALWLFIPFRTTPPSVEKYSKSEYYEVIEKLNEVTFSKPTERNNFEKYVWSAAEDVLFSATKYQNSGETAIEDGALFSGNIQNYEEITDNQTAGVIEADRIKRSDKYIYYLDGDTLRVYSIEGPDSAEIGSYQISVGKAAYAYAEEWEFYLSADCETVIVVVTFADNENNSRVGVLALDVTDPANIVQKGLISVTGGYLSSRYTNGDILLMTQFRVRTDPDFSDESAFLPQIDTGNGMESILMEDIVLPEKLTSSRYSVVCKIDAESMELEDWAAFLSYSEDFYVSAESIYAIRSFTDKADDGKTVSSQSKTEISRLYYGGEGMEQMGSTVVAGYVKDQYSLDEYEGILRVVTTTDLWEYTRIEKNGQMVNDMLQSGTSASLYCIDLTDWQIVAEVTDFAPAGETVQSVRFDQDAAYVCTAIVWTFTDPVFFFDLSDLSNITYKDTGDIEGYSSSLINFGNGYLLGIGVGDSVDSLKLEVYEESETGVVSVCSYERDNTRISEDYKAYYVDRGNQLIGLGAYTEDYMDEYWAMSDRYLLLLFDGYELRELLDVELPGDVDYKRAVYIDGYFYMFGKDAFVVERIGG